MKRIIPIWAVAIAAMSVFSDQARGQAAGGPLSPTEARAVDHCLGILRGCRLRDGAFSMVPNTGAADAPVWIAPYFVNHAMLALLAANGVSRNPADVAAVGGWIDWCVRHQDPNGYWTDYVGTVARYQSNGNVDAHDSSAALFLLVLDRYRRAGGTVKPEARKAAKLALNCIQKTSDKDGLTWAKPNYPVKYLMDNIEVRGGLLAAANLLATSDPTDAKAAATQAKAVANGLQRYWGGTGKQLFAWALHPNGKFDGGLDRLYPQGLAQLFGIASVTSAVDPFKAVVAKFAPDETPEGVGAERFLIAAARLGEPYRSTWRARTVSTTTRFNAAGNVYLFRPALAVLGLLEGADWMPR